MKRIIILGGEGMLGQMVFRVFSGSKEVAVKYTSRNQESASIYFEVDEGIGRLGEIIEVHGPFDYVINCIGVLGSGIDEQNSQTVIRAILVNSLFPRELATLAQNIGTKVIHISTDGVFGRNAGICVENRKLDTEDVYGKTKSLGEVIAPGVLNLRCSIIGPDAERRRGLLEWFLKQKQGAEVNGYIDHLWNGVTTLQYGKLCHDIIVEDYFESIRVEGPIHHFCPNASLSKYELLLLFKYAFRPDLGVKPVVSGDEAVCRILDTQYKSLKLKFGSGRSMKDAINELAVAVRKNDLLLKNPIEGEEYG